MFASPFRKLALAGAFLAAVANPACAGNYQTNGGEYAIAGAFPGDQVHPDLKINSAGGFLIWQDNRTDGDGLGVSARRLDRTFSGAMSTFRVNDNGADDQENAKVTLLNGGGAAFVWQGGKTGFQHIYARFLSPSNTWVTSDMHVNARTNGLQLDPSVATLSNGNVLVVWSAMNQVSSDSFQDVFGQLFTPTGQKLGSEFPVNQVTTYNQRNPVVTALSGGGFVVAWISEQQRTEMSVNPNMLYPSGSLPSPSVDLYARMFNDAGVAVGSEFLVNTDTRVCANPAIAGSADGGFAIVWGQKDTVIRSNSWDVFGRAFSATGVGGIVRRVNTETYGEQFDPQIAASGSEYLVTYNSLGHDGSREGVYGQFLRADGSYSGTERRINTTTPSQQIHPRAAGGANGDFLVVWTSFIGSPNNFDLFAQRYADSQAALVAPEVPYITILSSNSLSVSWPPQEGLSVSHYEVYADGAVTPTALVTNRSYWAMGNLLAGSSHTVRVAYVLNDDRRSPLSAPASGTTYSAMSTWGGIPQEWMTAHFGSDLFAWPSPYADSDGDGASNRDEFLAGTDPLAAASVLRIRLEPSPQGLFLNWNTQPSLVYQVQTSTDMANWSELGQPRFAAGTVDSLYVGTSSVGYYRVIRLR